MSESKKTEMDMLLRLPLEIECDNELAESDNELAFKLTIETIALFILIPPYLNINTPN